MLQIIRVYYDIKNRSEYEDFLFSYIIRSLLESGDLRLVKNISQYQGRRYLKCMDSADEEVEIFCNPLSETAIIGHIADTIYIQQTALYKTNSEILNKLPATLKDITSKIYIFDKSGVIGQWNTK